MTDQPQPRIDIHVCSAYVRGYMAYVWRGPFIYQVFSGQSRRDVEADAAHYAAMLRKGLT